MDFIGIFESKAFLNLKKASIHQSLLNKLEQT